MSIMYVSFIWSLAKFWLWFGAENHLIWKQTAWQRSVLYKCFSGSIWNHVTLLLTLCFNDILEHLLTLL